jgi:hypothetical protein
MDWADEEFLEVDPGAKRGGTTAGAFGRATDSEHLRGLSGQSTGSDKWPPS